MKKLAIITARGGSKRIPNKNIKSFLGKPIISYSIKAAIASNLFDEIMVSTDNLEIARISEELGASIPFIRSKNNSNDFATIVDVIVEVIDKYRKLGMEFEYTCCIFPCAPFLTGELLCRSFNKLKSSKLDCVFPVTKYGHPIQRALRLNDSDKIEMINPENLVVRTQDLYSTFHDLGQFYFFETKKIITNNKLCTDNTGYIEFKKMESHDIDDIDDWEIAEFKYKLLNKLL